MAFDAQLDVADGVGRIVLRGELDAAVAPIFKAAIDEAARRGVKRLVLLAEALAFMASAGLRVLVFAKQKMGSAVTIVIVGAQPHVAETIRQTGFHRSVIMLAAEDAHRAVDAVR
jgi:anti-anti-sigma factor